MKCCTVAQDHNFVNTSLAQFTVADLTAHERSAACGPRRRCAAQIAAVKSTFCPSCSVTVLRHADQVLMLLATAECLHQLLHEARLRFLLGLATALTTLESSGGRALSVLTLRIVQLSAGRGRVHIHLVL